MRKKKPSAVLRKIDCITHMSQMRPQSVQLVIADPPYNLGRKYHDYDDKRPREEYLAWAERWLVQIHRVLDKHGSFWLFMHDSMVSEMDVAAKRLGFHKRSHVIWAFTFGVNCAKNFTRAHTHLLYYTKAKTKFTFNKDDPDLRVPSARQLIYNDKRANPKGRLPDDVWILRPGELQEAFKGHGDVWLVNRICGTFHNRVQGFDNQIPLPIMERIILACSNRGDTVLDPFVGTGTTSVSAAMMGRNSIGLDISKTCIKATIARLKKQGDAEILL